MVEQLIETYGYWAVGLGTMLEGETIVILATLAAHRAELERLKVSRAEIPPDLTCPLTLAEG